MIFSASDNTLFALPPLQFLIVADFLNNCFNKHK